MVFLSFVLAVIVSITSLQADSPVLLPIDAVLVLDVSRSMITADPNRIANTAMNMFIDKLTPGRDKVGVVAYAGRVTYSRELTMLCEDEIMYLHNVIYGLEYASWTDHPLGLHEAIQLMSEVNEEGRQPFIIFLTDGNLNVNPSGTRTMAQAEYDKLVVIDLAIYNGFPIYSIGLNFDGQLDTRYIEIVAEQTGGLAFETANAEDLPDILTTIFSLMIALQLEEEPEEPVPSTIVYEIPIEPLYIPQESMPIHDIIPTPQTRQWIFVVPIVLLFGALTFFIFRKPRRVFTGRLEVELIGDIASNTEIPKMINLIEYGRRVSLDQLFSEKIPVEFTGITIRPSPSAPSFAPQLLISGNNKKKQMKFAKDFIEYDFISDISLAAGAEISFIHENTVTKVRIKYTM